MPSGIDPDTSRLLSIGMAFLAGVLVGAVLLTAVPGLLGGPTVVTAPPDPNDPPTSVTTVGPSCYDGEVNPNAGWVHEIASGESYPVTLNATVVHDGGTEMRADVVPVSGDRYRIELRTAEATSGRTLDCERVYTMLDMAVSLPTSYERLVVAVNGRELVSATREDTTADLYPLPNPIDATG